MGTDGPSGVASRHWAVDGRTPVPDGRTLARVRYAAWESIQGVVWKPRLVRPNHPMRISISATERPSQLGTRLAPGARARPFALPRRKGCGVR